MLLDAAALQINLNPRANASPLPPIPLHYLNGCHIGVAAVVDSIQNTQNAFGLAAIQS